MLAVAVAVAVPGHQFWLIVFGGVLVTFAVFGLLTESLPNRRLAACLGCATA